MCKSRLLSEAYERNGKVQNMKRNNVVTDIYNNQEAGNIHDTNKR